MKELIELIHPVEWFFLTYFACLGGVYLLLNFLSVFRVHRYMNERSAQLVDARSTGLQPPVTVIVPAHNEAETIVTSVQSLLQLEYGEYEVVVVNDGSTDVTLEKLVRAFQLVPFPEVYHVQMPTEPVRQIYRSATHPNLRVIDKENGGKADALNAGINNARYPLVCTIDADSILQRNSLRRVVQPFMEDRSTVAVGGNVRVANGCTVEDGFVTDVGLPRNPLALVQIIEYLRDFLFARLGWSQLNSLFVISGAFGCFKRNILVEHGGFRTDTVGEDMEMVVRLHRRLRLSGEKYRVTHVPDPICWSEVPEDLRSLKNQRARWQRGLSEALTMNFGLFLNRKGGLLSWFGFPFKVLFEWLGPIVEISGYAYMIGGLVFGWVRPEIAIVFFAIAVGVGTLLSVGALLLEEMSFRIYGSRNEILALSAVAVLESFGYRQMITVFRLVGLVQWALSRPRSWGETRRSGQWQKAA